MIIDTAAKATVPKSITALDLFKQNKNSKTCKNPADATPSQYFIPRSIQCIGITEICGHPGSGKRCTLQKSITFQYTLVLNVYCDVCSMDSGKTQFLLSLAAIASVGDGLNFSGVVFFGAYRHANASTNDSANIIYHVRALCCVDVNCSTFFSCRQTPT